MNVNIIEPVPFTFVLETIGVIFGAIAIGIAIVKQAKKIKEIK